MINDNEMTRLADMASALRPDWPPRSVRAYLATNHRARAYQDLAVALAYVAADPGSATPARLSEHGPWWLLTRPVVVTPVPGRPVCPDHPSEPTGSRVCGACAAESVPAPIGRLRAALRPALRAPVRDIQSAEEAAPLTRVPPGPPGPSEAARSNSRDISRVGGAA
jgi:hypothetical protein